MAAATALALGLAMAAAAGSELAPTKGRFLVAERQLDDPNFRQTVVLLTEYGEDGAMGLIVNWPTAAPAAELLPQIDGLAERADTLFVGGPVARRVMLMLVRSPGELSQAERIFADVHLSTSRELLLRVLAGEVESTALRLYSGYSGWSAGQLDLELAAGGWRVLPGDAELVFAADPDAVWAELMRRDEMRWTRRDPPARRPLAP